MYRPHILPSQSVQKQRKKNKSANMIICATQTTLIGESVTNALTSCVEVIIRGAKVIIIILLLITAPHRTPLPERLEQNKNLFNNIILLLLLCPKHL